MEGTLWGRSGTLWDALWTFWEALQTLRGALTVFWTHPWRDVLLSNLLQPRKVCGDKDEFGADVIYELATLYVRIERTAGEQHPFFFFCQLPSP